jgi:hypothetical protein
MHHHEVHNESTDECLSPSKSKRGLGVFGRMSTIVNEGSPGNLASPGKLGSPGNGDLVSPKRLENRFGVFGRNKEDGEGFDSLVSPRRAENRLNIFGRKDSDSDRSPHLSSFLSPRLDQELKKERRSKLFSPVSVLRQSFGRIIPIIPFKDEEKDESDSDSEDGEEDDEDDDEEVEDDEEDDEEDDDVVQKAATEEDMMILLCRELELLSDDEDE